MRDHMLIDILVFDGVDEMDAWGPAEVFRSASALGTNIAARLVVREPQPVVTCSYGLRFLPDGTFAPGEADVLDVTGGGWAARAEAGAWAKCSEAT